MQRLKTYMSNLIVLPLKQKKRQDISTIKLVKSLEKIRQPETKLKARVPSEEEKKFQAFVTLRKARADVRLLGKRLKKKRGEGDLDEDKRSKRRRGGDQDD